MGKGKTPKPGITGLAGLWVDISSRNGVALLKNGTRKDRTVLVKWWKRTCLSFFNDKPWNVGNQTIDPLDSTTWHRFNGRWMAEWVLEYIWFPGDIKIHKYPPENSAGRRYTSHFFWCRRRLFLAKSQGQTESYRCNSGGERIQVVGNFKVHGPSLILKRLERQETYGPSLILIHSSSLTWLFGKSMNISKLYFLYVWICWLSPTLLINTSS